MHGWEVSAVVSVIKDLSPMRSFIRRAAARTADRGCSVDEVRSEGTESR